MNVTLTDVSSNPQLTNELTEEKNPQNSITLNSPVQKKYTLALESDQDDDDEDIFKDPVAHLQPTAANTDFKRIFAQKEAELDRNMLIALSDMIIEKQSEK